MLHPLPTVFSSFALQIPRKKGPDGKLLSMGFGFVEVDSAEVAKEAVKKLQVCEV